MEFIKENKITLLICGFLLGLALIISFLIKSNYFIGSDNLEINNYLKNYKVNEIVPINMNEEQIARKYLAEYLKLIYLDPETAYDLIDSEYRQIRFGSIDKFKEHFDNLISDKFFDAKVTELSVSRKSSYKEFYIVDSNDNTFVFREYSIMQYKVLFDIITV